MVFSVVTVTAARATFGRSKENKEETDGVRATEEEILYSKTTALSIGAASENGGSSHFVRVRVL